MERAQFLEWFKKVFLVCVSNLEGKKVLFFDGHLSHISVEVVELAIKNEVVLICIPPHSSTFLQPLDVSVFWLVKKE